MSVLLELTMFPTNKGISVSKYVSPVVDMIRKSGVTYKLTAMSTIIETKELSEALRIVQQAHDILEKDSDRVYATMTMDIQKNKSNRLESKIKSIEDKIGDVNK